MRENINMSSSQKSDREIAVVACSYLIDPISLKNRLVLLGNRLGVKFHGVVVTNGPHEAFMDDPRWLVLSGSNEDLDFSAYFEGLLYWLNNKAPLPSKILFINDSLFSTHSAYANVKSTIRLLGLLGDIQVPALIGKTDRYMTVCHRNPWSGLNIYVSTYCFAMNSAAMMIFLNLKSWADYAGLGHNVDINSSEWGDGLQPVFREFLRANIVYITSPYKWRNLTSKDRNQALLQKKARCIYFEHRLSGEIGLNGSILPINSGLRAQVYIYLSELFIRQYNRLLRS